MKPAVRRSSQRSFGRAFVGVWLFVLAACSPPLNPNAEEGPAWRTVVPGLQQFSPQAGTLALRMDLRMGLRCTGLRLRLSDEKGKGLPIDARPEALAAQDAGQCAAD